MSGGKPRVWIAAGAVCALTSLVILAWVAHLLNDHYGNIAQTQQVISDQTDAPTLEIVPGNEVSQTFVASGDDLSEVEVLLATFKRDNSARLVLTVTDNHGARVARATAPAGSIADNAYYTFAFDQVPGTAGGRYTATLSSANAKAGNAFAAWTSDCDCYKDGTLSIGGVEKPGRELVMRVNYQHDGVVTWWELVNRLSQYKPGIVKGVGMVILALVTLGLSLATVGGVVLAAGHRTREAKPEKTQRLWLALSVIVAALVVLLTGAYSGI